ncbi:unnamed protein product [Scytosiphon promiscuus]
MEETTRPILPLDEGIEPLSTSATNVQQRTDYAWAVVFKLNVIFTLGLAMYTGAIEAMPLIFANTVGCYAWLFGYCVLRIMISYSTDTLEASFFSFAAMSGMMAVAALAMGHWLAWIVPALLSGLTMLFFSKHRSRIAFSSANLKVATIAIKAMLGTRPTDVFGHWEVSWVVLSAAAAWGSIASLNTATTPSGDVYSAAYCHNEIPADDDADHLICWCSVGEMARFFSPCVMTERPISSFILACFWLASLTWTTTVIRNLASVAVTSSVTSWWISPAGNRRHVQAAVQRAHKGSFGSVCKAAAASTVARLPIMVMRCLSSVFPLKPLGVAADYVPAYAIYFIGIYGVDFSEASRRVSGLVRRRGVTAIASDTVVDVGLAGLALAATALFMILFFLMLNSVLDPPFGMGGLSELFGKNVGFLSMSYIVAVALATILEIPRAGFKAVLVCFLQDPQALATNHGREIYNELSEAWREMQADCLEVDSDDEHQAWPALWTPRV